jgi:hypothetical protein
VIAGNTSATTVLEHTGVAKMTASTNAFARDAWGYGFGTHPWTVPIALLMDAGVFAFSHALDANRLCAAIARSKKTSAVASSNAAAA